MEGMEATEGSKTFTKHTRKTFIIERGKGQEIFKYALNYGDIFSYQDLENRRSICLGRSLMFVFVLPP